MHVSVITNITTTNVTVTNVMTDNGTNVIAANHFLLKIAGTLLCSTLPPY